MLQLRAYGAILTSMNLHSFSADNNIEVGVKTSVGFGRKKVGNIVNSFVYDTDFDKEAWDFFQGLISNSEILYKKIPVYDKGRLGLKKKEPKNFDEKDKLTNFFDNKPKSYVR